MNTLNKCVVKISVSSETNYTHIDDVVYYRSGLSPDFITRWLWYFEYLAALVKVNNPHRKVEFFKGPQDVLLGKEWHEHRRNAILKSRLTKLKKLEKGVVDDDLFHFKSQDNEAEKRRVLSQIDDLEKDKYPIDEFPENINKIKNYIRI
jgi:hypothetical protein